MREAPNQRGIWLALGVAGAIMFRVNSGKAWASAGPPKRLTDGSIVLPAGSRPISLGLTLADGSPVSGQADLQGYTSVVITPEMVGCTVAVATFIEVKRSDGKGRVSDDQRLFVDRMRLAGAIAGVAASPEEAQAIVKGYRPPRFDA